jgi:hypothetical protein
MIVANICSSTTYQLPNILILLDSLVAIIPKRQFDHIGKKCYYSRRSFWVDLSTLVQLIDSTSSRGVTPNPNRKRLILTFYLKKFRTTPDCVGLKSTCRSVAYPSGDWFKSLNQVVPSHISMFDKAVNQFKIHQTWWWRGQSVTLAYFAWGIKA